MQRTEVIAAALFAISFWDIMSGTIRFQENEEPS